MHKVSSLLVAGTLLLGGCASLRDANLLGDFLGGVFTDRVDPAWGYLDVELEPAAAASCTQHASQYGEAVVVSSQRVSTAMVQVNGTLDQQRSFVCNFRNDGRITAFRIS